MSTAIVTQTQGTAVQLFESFTDESKYNILRPSETVIVTSPFYNIYANIIRFTDDDTYAVEGGKVALNRRALDRIASASGISIVNVIRTDDGRNPDYAEVSVQAMMKRPDGSMIYATGKKSVDVSAYIDQQAASQRIKGKNEGEIKTATERERLQLRKFKVERAETGAKNRAIKQLMALKSSYNKEEIRKPFIVPQITVNMELIMSDPVARQLAAAQALGASTDLYGTAHKQLPVQPSLSSLVEHTDTRPESGPGALSISVVSGSDHLPIDNSSQNDQAPDTAYQDWKDARSMERLSKLTQLFVTRQHRLTPDQIRRVEDGTPDEQAKTIVMLLSRPEIVPAVTWTATEAQMKRLLAIAKSAGYNSDELHLMIAEKYNGITSLKDLTREQYDELCGDEKKSVRSWLLANVKGKEEEEDGLPF